jgi:hypothetical protein
MKRFADLEGPDFFPTPEWATHALIDNEEFEGTIWEPACGDGTMAEVLKQTGCPVEASDLYDRGYGESGIDFLRAIGSSTISSPTLPTIRPKALSERAWRNRGASLVYCCGWRFLRGPIAKKPSSPRRLRPASGYSASASPFTLLEPFKKAAERRPTHGSYGTSKPPTVRPSSDGCRPGIRPATPRPINLRF